MAVDCELPNVILSCQNCVWLVIANAASRVLLFITPIQQGCLLCTREPSKGSILEPHALSPSAFIAMYDMRKTMLWRVCVGMAMPVVIFLVAQ
jgi:hypothetical protein